MVFFFLTAIGAGGALAFYLVSLRALPPVESLLDHPPAVSTKVFADGGELLGEFRVERGVHVPLKQIPKGLIQAVLAVEDARFYEHKGLSYWGMLRAALHNLWRGEIKEGGSTITQQLAKVMFLTPERSLTRKIREIVLARRIEARLAKDQIFEIYLNKIYFGHGAYGVEMAARTYFGKPVGELTLAETAVLAGIPKSPTYYSPYNDAERAKQRQIHVLRRMEEEGFLKPKEVERALKQPLQLRNLRTREEIAPYFLDHIRKYLEETYGEERIYREGLHVHTTLDATLQRAAVRALQEGLREVDKRQGFRGPIGRKELKKGKVVEEGGVQPTLLTPGEILTGTVLDVSAAAAKVKARGSIGRMGKEEMRWALEGFAAKKKKKPGQAGPADLLKPGDQIHVRVKAPGSRGKEAVFSLEQEPQVEGALICLEPATGYIRALVGGYHYVRSEFNRAMLARRQAGSAFKPIVYATAIERGLAPASILLDTPVKYDDTELKPGWKPENYDRQYWGPISLRTALAYSRNVITIKLLESIGIEHVLGMAKRLGMAGPFPRDLTLALGSGSVTPLELTAAFAAVANQGVWAEPMGIKYVTDGKGRILESRAPRMQEVMSRETAYLLTSMLEDVVRYGTGQRAKALGRPVAGKTGTTNNYMDAWFVGFTPYLAAGVWVGYDDNRSLGNKETGARAASPIWVAFMQESLKEQPADGFPPPDGIIYSAVDPKTGLLASPEVGEEVREVFRKRHEPRGYTSLAERARLAERASAELARADAKPSRPAAPGSPTDSD